MVGGGVAGEVDGIILIDDSDPKDSSHRITIAGLNSRGSASMYECFYFEAKLKLEPHRATYIYTLLRLLLHACLQLLVISR